MKVAAFVLLLAVAGLLVVGAVDAKKFCPPKKHEDKGIAIAKADADACAKGDKLAVAVTRTDTFADACGKCEIAGASSSSLSIAA